MPSAKSASNAKRSLVFLIGSMKNGGTNRITIEHVEKLKSRYV